SGRTYAERIDRLLKLYPWDIQLTQLNLLDSHDTARMLNIAGGDKASVALATLLLMTFPGAPSLFYGDEIGLPGEQEPDSRRAFPWNAPDTWDQEALAYHKALIALRHAHPALRTGDFQTVYADADVYCFVRADASERVLVAVNAGDVERDLAIALDAGPAGLEPIVLYGSGQVAPNGASLAVRLPARSGSVVKV
ncbi:MAG TPA: alpha-amylase family glycosyl hydrolase, partial [Roseiflexaceae bacterium]|nr:alpha-amylase family glycosyl hydrolase [Roseiflexaceae bacterium]